jgi:hypothetical protein
MNNKSISAQSPYPRASPRVAGWVGGTPFVQVRRRRVAAASLLRSSCVSRSLAGDKRAQQFSSRLRWRCTQCTRPAKQPLCSGQRASTAWPGFRPVLRQVRACLSEAAQHNACPQRDKRGGRDKPRPAEHGPMTSIASSCMRCCGQRRDDVAAPPKTFPSAARC